MKEGGNYFSHDYGARNDPKLLELQMEMGGQGLAIWWCLVEMLWENEGYLPKNFKSIAFSLHWAKAEEVQKVVEAFGLFEWDDERFWNNSALGRIEKRKKISETRRESGRTGGVNSGASRRSRQANAPEAGSTPEANAKQMLQDGEASLQAINKYINPEINKEINPEDVASDEEKEKFFEIFFFEKNFIEPDKELARFLKHYQERHWCRKGELRPAADRNELARKWSPEKQGQRVTDIQILEFVKVVWTYVAMEKGRKGGGDFLRNIESLREWHRELTITMKTNEWGLYVQDVVVKNNLKNPYEKVTIKRKTA